MRIPFRAAFARVDDDTVEDVIRLSAYSWYAVAALLMVLLIFTALAGKTVGGDAIDPIMAGLGGWFLFKTKSRAVAGALFLYAIATAIVFVAKLLGLVESNLALLTVLLALYAGWRGWTATRFWQKRACAEPQWNHVASGAALAIIATLIGQIVFVIGIKATGMTGQLPQFLLAAALFLVPVAFLVWFTKRRGFSRNDPSCPWPPKK